MHAPGPHSSQTMVQQVWVEPRDLQFNKAASVWVACGQMRFATVKPKEIVCHSHSLPGGLFSFISNWDPPKCRPVKEHSVSLSDSSKLHCLKCLDIWNCPDILLVHVLWFIIALRTLIDPFALSCSSTGKENASLLLFWTVTVIKGSDSLGDCSGLSVLVRQ